MREELVEIYSDAANSAIMRHPARRFPGMLIQGDSLSRITNSIDYALRHAVPGSENEEELRALSEEMHGRLRFYADVLTEHGLPLPFETLPEHLKR